MNSEFFSLKTDGEVLDMERHHNNKRNRHLCKIATIYGFIWAALAISFWFFYNNSQMAMLHVIVVQYVSLPIIIFVFSIIIGIQRLPLRLSWITPVLFSITYLLYSLLTLSLAQFVLAGVASFPDIVDFIAAILLSTIGMLIGTGAGKLCKKE